MPIRILHFMDFYLDNSHQEWASNLLSLMIESIKKEHVQTDSILFIGDMLNKKREFWKQFKQITYYPIPYIFV